ncbi:hypothetical protein PILCRDRAFT_488459 [Piloderma croceum F 1598]|uniref:Uncharacterized protein n=1 Tax=Piloderma croceum (strain F 1598) TaxID=765440 RepID=A0A0C3BWK0_PILCF|nr:hypothetical protein PILCRDRAFT_488459 [Piloderma croceum F 1598]
MGYPYLTVSTQRKSEQRSGPKFRASVIIFANGCNIGILVANCTSYVHKIVSKI